MSEACHAGGFIPVWGKPTVGILLFTIILSRYIQPFGYNCSSLFIHPRPSPGKKIEISVNLPMITRAQTGLNWFPNLDITLTKLKLA